DKCHLSIPPLVYAASSRLGRAQIPYRLRERSEPDLRRRVIALRSATGFRPTKVLVANQHSGRDTRSTASVRLGRAGSDGAAGGYSHPGRVLLPDGVAGSIVGAPPSVRLGRAGNSGAAG